MADAMTLIGTVNVGSGGVANITFSSIPSTFTDLQLVWSVRTNRSGGLDPIALRFNGSTSGYSGKALIGFGSGSGYSESNLDQYSNPLPYFNIYAGAAATSAGNVFAGATAYIPNYAGSTNKSASIDWGLSQFDPTSAWNGVNAGLWSNTAAITSVSITPTVGSAFVQYSTASLYGITKGSGGASVS